MRSATLKFLLIYLTTAPLLFPQNKTISISGFIYDSRSNETLIGTNILVYKDSFDITNPPLLGAASNNFGFYQIPKLGPGKYYLIFRHLGYKSSVKETSVDDFGKNITLTVYMIPENISLEEIIIEGKILAKEKVSTIEISPNLLSRLPSFSGEVDLFRTLQLLPGVNKSSELSNGIYIRGGSPDQTLTLVDGSVIYNPSHLGNIASTFNSNAISDIRLMKGAFPSEYGGRLSSVLDVKLKSGSKEKDIRTFGLGTINSFFSLEGPLKSSSTYILSGRWMYYDFWQKRIDNSSNTPRYNFYDLNGKINFITSETSAFTISTMYSKDRMYNAEDDQINYEIDWENFITSVNWLQVNNNSLFLNSNLSFIKYNFSSKINIGTNSASTTSYYTNPKLTDIIFKQAAEVKWQQDQKLKTGVEISFHNYDLLFNEYYDATLEKDPYAGKDINSIEAALYIQNESSFGDKFTTNIGSRIYYFGDRRYFNVEPRLSLSYMLFNDFYIKSSAAIVNQFLHLITRDDITLPTDLWYPATKNIKPGKSTQYVFGVDYYFNEDEYQVSLESYYRDMKNLYGYMNSIIINPLEDNLEEQFISGVGEAYGLELFCQKRKGNLTGWIGYTLSWTKRKFNEFNNGRVFYPKYDRRHDLSIVLSYDIIDNLSVSSTFTYATGLRYTLPPGQFIFNPIGISGDDDLLLNYNAFNESKFPEYHKLDLSAGYKISLKELTLNFFLTLYNVYNRNNAYAQYVVFDEDEQGELKSYLKKISLFPFIPSLSVSVTF